MSAVPCTILVVAAPTRIPTLQRTLSKGVHVFAGDIRGRLRHSACRPPAVCTFFGVTEDAARGLAREYLADLLERLVKKQDVAVLTLQASCAKADQLCAEILTLSQRVAELEQDGVSPEEQLEHRSLLAKQQQLEALQSNVALDVESQTQAAARIGVDVEQARKRVLALLQHAAGSADVEPLTELSPLVIQEDGDDDSANAPHLLEVEHDALEPSGVTPAVVAPRVAGHVDAAARDDLTCLDGIGAGRQRILNENGIRTYEHVAQMSPEQLDGLIDGIGLDRAKDIITEARVLSI